jgi:hypothetical protein
MFLKGIEGDLNTLHRMRAFKRRKYIKINSLRWRMWTTVTNSFTRTYRHFLCLPASCRVSWDSPHCHCYSSAERICRFFFVVFKRKRQVSRLGVKEEKSLNLSFLLARSSYYYFVQHNLVGMTLILTVRWCTVAGVRVLLFCRACFIICHCCALSA